NGHLDDLEVGRFMMLCISPHVHSSTATTTLGWPMHMAPILTIKSGSSSLNLGLFIERDGEEHIFFDVLADGIGKRNGKLEMRNAARNIVRSEALDSTPPE